MRRKRLEILQWTGLLAGALVWTAQHVIGYGVTEAVCGPGNAQFGISNDVWQASLMAVAAVVILGAEAAALTVFVETRSLSYESEPAPGRIRFFAIAAMVANVIFLLIVLLDGFAAIFSVECRGS
jgi:hypothetical protein